MKTPASTSGRRYGALAAAVTMGMASVALPFSPAQAAETSVDDAVFSWAVNEESGGGAYFGGANWMIAGEAPDMGSSHVWSNAEVAEHFTAESGNTTITRPNADGEQELSTLEKRNEDANGKKLTTSADSSSWNQANISSGTGTVDPEANSAEIQWDGSFSLIYYGGLTYWSISDPKLVVEDGVGTVTGTATGFGADRDDTSKWLELPATEITLADLPEVDVTEDGIVATPAYSGVEVEVQDDGVSGPQNRDKDGWGSFPQSWVDFNTQTGQAAYWYTSGGLADVKKPAAPITIGYTTDALRYLKPGAEPGDPTNVSASQNSSDSSTITWTRPESSDRRIPPAYQVQWTPGKRTATDPGADGDWTGRTVSGAVTSTTVRGLTPQTTYTARVRSMNHDIGQDGSDYGISGYWEYVTFTTAQETTPSPAPPPPEPPEDTEDGDSTESSGDGAVFRWAMNREAGSGAYYGGCNFLSAGISGDNGGSTVWGDDSLYSASDGNVTIRKATATGGWTTASWDTKCLDRNGAAVSSNGKDQWTEQQVVITGGEREQLDGGGMRIEWDGSFTVAFYGGLTYWWASDPVLEVDGSGNGTVTARASGYGASMYDNGAWTQLKERTITLATLRGVDTDTAEDDGGFTVTPEYLGVTYSGSGGESDSGGSNVGGEEGNPTGQASKTAQNEDYWGSFPTDFVDFQNETGQFSYWFTSGGARDPFKVTEPLTVAYSSDYDAGPGSYSGEAGGGSAGAPGAGAPGSSGAPASATNPNAGKKPGQGASPADANFDEDRSAFSQMAQEAAGETGLSGRTWVIAGLTTGAGLAATITFLVYVRRRLGLDPRMFM